ncbi:lactonase family protein [Streptomyces sp. 6N223]|uniref:lactonase family protein n=1 Tax=Streptomyces sp. 6N223 TaxID=3457412 RepID=UPI003FD5A605
MTPPPLSRRAALSLPLLGAAAVALPLPSAHAAPGPFRVYLGAYTGGTEEGIGVATADDATGGLQLDTVVPAASPTWLTLAPSGGVLYAAHETAEGQVSALSLGQDGAVTGTLGSCPSGGSGAVHLDLHAGGGHLFVANYGSGSVAVVTLAEDGTPQEVSQVVQYTGSGPNPDRQEGPHAHMVLSDPAAPDRVLACDLGTDTVHVYAFDPAQGQLTSEHEVKMAPGSGPRHLALHPEADAAYVLGELDCTLTVCAYDRATGALTPQSTVSLLPDGTSPDGNTAAEVLVSSDGRFVYASVRGPDIIAAFAVEGTGGTELRLLGRQSCGGSWPRHIALDSEERWLYAANQYSGSVAVFARDADTGTLTPAGEPLPFPQVVCAIPAAPAA